MAAGWALPPGETIAITQLSGGFLAACKLLTRVDQISGQATEIVRIRQIRCRWERSRRLSPRCASHLSVSPSADDAFSSYDIIPETRLADTARCPMESCYLKRYLAVLLSQAARSQQRLTLEKVGTSETGAPRILRATSPLHSLLFLPQNCNVHSKWVPKQVHHSITTHLQ